MTVGICFTDEALILKRVVEDIADGVVRVVSELEADEVLVGTTIVTTILIWELPMEPTAVKVSVTGDTMLDVLVGTACVVACVVVLVSRGNSREVDVEDEALGDRSLPEIGVWVETVGLVLVLVKD
jgi:hypothetical protein